MKPQPRLTPFTPPPINLNDRGAMADLARRATTSKLLTLADRHQPPAEWLEGDEEQLFGPQRQPASVAHEAQVRREVE